MEIKAALAQARKAEEAQFAKDWQDRLKQLRAEEVCCLCTFLCLARPSTAPEAMLAMHVNRCLMLQCMQSAIEKICHLHTVLCLAKPFTVPEAMLAMH